MKVGRNQPCPCGSGKKYKKCCLSKKNVSTDLLYRRIGEAHDRLAHRLMRYGYEVFGESALGFALDEFRGWPEEGLSDEDLADHQSLFYPWFIFNWEYDADPNLPPLNGPEDVTIAELYAERKGDRLNPIEAQIIEATARQPFSFYEILECRPGQGYRLQDILRGTVSDVIEKKGSENARRGNILFARVVQIDSLAMLMGCGTILIPPAIKPDLIRFRQWLQGIDDPITAETLYDYDLEVRELYLDIFSDLTRPPQLHNTDGDPLSFHTIYYEIDSAEIAFERLKALSVIDSEADLREDADLDGSGRIIRVEIPWGRRGHKKNAALDNTILGHLVINDRRLEVQVNSASRAEIIRKEIKKRLGKHARYLTTQIQSTDALLETAREREGAMSEPGKDHEELMQIPEVREQIEKMISAHWKNWVDEKIPALGHITPRQAVKDPDGRESVEALLLDAERHMDDNAQTTDAAAAAIADVRRRLGLDRPAPAADATAVGGKNAERVAEVKSKIEAFGRTRLGPEYTGLALALADKIGRMRKLSIQRGRIEIWAAAIVYVIARLNFLFDPANDTYITPDGLCDFFGTKKSTVGNKASLIQDTAEILPGDPDFSSAKIADMFRVYETRDGFLIPGTMLDALNEQPVEDGTPPAALRNPNSNKAMPRSTARAKSPRRDTRKKSADDRQLKLFDDK
jgi:hypothetical protein